MVNQKILFVDDEVEILNTYKRTLRKYFEIFVAENGNDAIEILKKEGPFPVVISDMKMPIMNGAVFLKHVYDSYPDTVRILLTGKSDLDETIQVINEGHIFRFLAKPCPPKVLFTAIVEGIKQYHLICSEHVLLEKTLRGAINLLSDVLTITSPAEFSRSARIKKITKQIMGKIDPKLVWKMDIASTLSHLGCVTLPKELIRKKETCQPLSRQESLLYAKHAVSGSKLVGNIPRMGEISDTIKYQEKNYDGTGFPEDEKLSGDDIPLMSRIVRVAYEYDLLIVLGETKKKAFEKVDRMSGRYYDNKIVDLLKQVVLDASDDSLITKFIPVSLIEEGMILSDDVRASNGMVLVTKGHEVTELLKLKIMKYADAGKIVGKIKVDTIVN